MASANVPEWGKWDSQDNVPYTVYFDKARKNQGGKMINPNDPGENPEMFPNLGAPAPVPPAKSPDRGAAVPKWEEWNVSDPQSFENLADLFTCRLGRNPSRRNSPHAPKHPSNSTHSQPSKFNKPKSCCLPW